MNKLLIALLLICLPSLAQAQSTVKICYPTGTGNSCQEVTLAHPLPVNASVTASIAGFAPGAAYASLTSTASSAQVALPSGAVVLAFNTGTTAVSCLLNTTTATGVADRNIIQAGSWIAFTVGSNTNIGCINQAGDAASNKVVLSGGTGLPTGAGGGGSSGGGGVVTNAGTFAVQNTAATPAGTNVIGHVINDASSAVIGHVIVDTAPSTAVTNAGTFAVQAASTLAAETTKVIGTTRAADGSGNLITSTANAWDVNIKSGGNANGQTTMSASSPTTMASDQRVSTANSSVAISVSTATTTQLVALSGSTKIYVTALDVIAGGTGNITFVYGTGSNCGTGTTSLTGAYNLTAQAGLSKGAGFGAVLVTPAGQALCVTTSAAVQMSGSVAYQQF